MKRILFLLSIILFFSYVPAVMAFDDWQVTSISENRVYGFTHEGDCLSANMYDSVGHYLGYGSSCAYTGYVEFPFTIPDGTFYVVVNPGNYSMDSNMFSVQNGSLVDLLPPTSMPTPDTSITPNVFVYDFESNGHVTYKNRIKTSLNPNLCNTIDWNVYNTNNELVSHIKDCEGNGELLIVDSPLPDGSYYVYANAYIFSSFNYYANFTKFYSGVFYIVNDHLYNTYPSPTPTSINEAPTVSPIAAPTSISYGTQMDVSADFTDTNILDTHTAVWDWGDGTSSTGVVTENNGAGTVTGQHTYLTSGIYSVKLTVTDSAGASTESFYNYVSVYNPSTGWASGGKEYTSPAGALLSNPSASGVAEFGFQVRYQGSNPIPSGQNVSFNYDTLSFESTSYQWLVVNNAKALLKASGTMNGQAGYTILVSAIDQSPQKGVVRVQLKDPSNSVIYDTQIGQPDTADPIIPVSKGKIKVQ